MLRALYPTEYAESIYIYPFEKAYEEGKRLVIFDIDNTFVPHGAPADDRSLALIRRLKEIGFSLCAVSNNREPRVKMFCEAAAVPYVFKAGKPKTAGYLKAAREAGCRPGEAIFFGDQIFTDIWGANRAGIHSVLIKPIDRSTDEIQIRFKRYMEKPIVQAFFREKGLDLQSYFY